ncbi:MAG: heavy-metal-associated domain-containing protein [Gammaproteobacteria bacterium]|nr:heavy-metal-associated domain-containing protein [Gammaproteobacteria bacterium]
MTQQEQLEIQSSKIKCGGCVSAIENGLKDFSGITEIKVDVETNIVSVKGNGLDKEVIENKLAELGYPAP